MRASQKTHRILMIVFAAFMLVVIACSCGDIDTGTTTGGTTGTTTGGTSEGTVTVINNSSISICYVFVSPDELTEWGNDILGDTDTLEPGETLSVTVAPGVYDLGAFDCEQNSIDEDHDITVAAGEERTWTFTDN
jgi:hypothetical protein